MLACELLCLSVCCCAKMLLYYPLLFYVCLFVCPQMCVCREQGYLSDLCTDPLSGNWSVCNADDLGSHWSSRLGRRSDCSSCTPTHIWFKSVDEHNLLLLIFQAVDILCSVLCLMMQMLSLFAVTDWCAVFIKLCSYILHNGGRHRTVWWWVYW